MGIVNFGVPFEQVTWLKEKYGCETFVEGGTFKGVTTNRMASVFSHVVTIERDETLFREAKSRFPHENIEYLKGDTRQHLPEVLSKHSDCLVWLDAHWSGVGTYGEDDECPLLEELEIIFGILDKTTILIDDARLFLAPPPSPHKYSAWPTMDQIIRVLPVHYRVIVYEDVIYVLDESKFNQFQVYLQSLIDTA